MASKLFERASGLYPGLRSLHARALVVHVVCGPLRRFGLWILRLHGDYNVRVLQYCDWMEPGLPKAALDAIFQTLLFSTANHQTLLMSWIRFCLLAAPAYAMFLHTSFLLDPSNNLSKFSIDTPFPAWWQVEQVDRLFRLEMAFARRQQLCKTHIRRYCKWLLDNIPKRRITRCDFYYHPLEREKTMQIRLLRILPLWRQS